LLVLAFVVLAEQQGSPASKFEVVRYPPLAIQARIQGDVHLSCEGSEIKVIAGHPLIAAAAIQNLKDVGVILEGCTEVFYHFVIIDAIVTRRETVVRRGDALDRFFLRALHLKTDKVLVKYECVENPEPKNNRSDLSGTVRHIWVYGKGYCPQYSSTIASR
jgi:hypothetical protein